MDREPPWFTNARQTRYGASAIQDDFLSLSKLYVSDLIAGFNFLNQLNCCLSAFLYVLSNMMLVHVF